MMEERDDFSYLDSTEYEYYKKFGISVEKIDRGFSLGVCLSYDKYAKERGIDIIVHKPDMEMINRYYKPYNQNSDLYILKPEFAPIKCDVDYKKKYYYVHD